MWFHALCHNVLALEDGGRASHDSHVIHGRKATLLALAQLPPYGYSTSTAGSTPAVLSLDDSNISNLSEVNAVNQCQAVLGEVQGDI
jgi:hypothetical protein